MLLKNRIQLYWRHYTALERGFIFLPFLLLTPRLVTVPDPGRNGESSQEFVITFVMLIGLLWYGIKQQRNSSFQIKWNDKGTWLLSAMSLFTVWSGLSLLWTNDIGATLDHTVLWLNYCVLIFLGKMVLRRRSVVGLSGSLMGAALAIASVRLFQYVISASERPTLSPIFANIGVETELLVTVLPVILLTYLTARRKKIALSSLIVVPIVLAGSLSTYQRTPILATLAGLSLLGFSLLLGWVKPFHWGRIFILAGVLIATVWFQLLLPSGTRQQDSEVLVQGKDFITTKFSTIHTLEPSAEARLTAWMTAATIFTANPILGLGAGGFKTSYPQYRSQANDHLYVKAYTQIDGMEANYRTHNEFLQIGSELGLIGVALIGAILLIIIILLGKIRRGAPTWAIGVGCGALAFLVSSNLTSFSFRWIPCGYNFFLLICLLLPTIANIATTSNTQQISVRKFSTLIWAVALLFVILGVSRTTQVLLGQYYEVLAQQQNQYEESAAQFYQKSLAINPYNFTAAYKYGLLLYKEKQPRASIQYLAFGLQHGLNDVSVYGMLGLAHLQAGNKATAKETLRQATSIYPTSLFLRTLYAEVLAQTDTPQAVSEQFALAHAINARDAEMWKQVIGQGIQSAIVMAHNKQLTHPTKLLPKSGVGVIQEYRQLYLNE